LANPNTVIVVPCYNEAKRLRERSFIDFVKDYQDIQVLFVNDGSIDETQDVLRNICIEDPAGLSVLNLHQNVGKAEAVRQGFIEAFKRSPKFIAMWDADLSSPLKEVIGFQTFLDNNEDFQLVMGTRVKLLGRNIRRSTPRHIIGRIAATLISFALKLDVYDTQCGAKLFRTNEFTRVIFDHPFESSWIFDVELIARLIKSFSVIHPGYSDKLIYEFPLHDWCEMTGSKIRPSHYFKSLIDLIRIKIIYR
jgi:dolichyl-phosphate beta-glucosyltransferase